jgi:GNAT superfamily N-acetyltransferase
MVPIVSLSEIDSERFGIRAARALEVTEDTLPAVLDYCAANRVVFLIARCSASDLRAAQAMERRAFALMDTLVYYTRDLERAPVPSAGSAVVVRPLRPGEAPVVTGIAGETFRGYSGHYHADPRLDRTRCDEAYISWASRSCVDPAVADVVLVAESESDIVGFATLRMRTAIEGEGVLFGVKPAAQGKGVYRSLMIGGMEWCASRGATTMVVSTQLVNVTVQKVWSRLGFEVARAHYTFHGWFDGASGPPAVA